MKKETETLKCTYKYTNGTICNRPLTRGYKDKEGKQYCIFHARNDEKLPPLKQQMLEEISKAAESFNKDIKTQNLSEDNEKHQEEINRLRSKYALNYEGAYIPNGFDIFTNFSLEVDISFMTTIFCGSVNFIHTTFKGKVNFDEAYFFGKADFQISSFKNESSFKGVTFEKMVNFNQTRFKEVSYIKAIFKNFSNFLEAVFEGKTDFRGVVFNNEADFSDAIFIHDVKFNESSFNRYAYFTDVIFSSNIFFSETIFRGKINFHGTIFNETSWFNDAIFIGETEFANVYFRKFVALNACKIDNGKIKFLDTIFFSASSFQDISEGSNITFINCCFFGVSFLRSRIINIAFSNCRFNLTEEWIFKKIHEIKKKNAIIDNNISFLSERSLYRLQIIEEEEEAKIIGRLNKIKKSFLRRNLLLEHIDFLKQPHLKLLMRKLSKRGLKIASAIMLHLFQYKSDYIRNIISSLDEASKPIDFGEVRDSYMQLKVNMDRMKDYDLANDFYYGEMEMKRLGEKWYKPKRWFLSLYNTLSKYGNAPFRAVIMFFVLIFIFSFPLFFMKLGIKDLSSQNKNQTSYKVVSLEPNFAKNLGEMASLSLYNMTALSNLTRSPYEPLEKWTFYYVSVVQYFFRPVQLALIILAIRRKVKRGEE